MSGAAPGSLTHRSSLHSVSSSAALPFSSSSSSSSSSCSSCSSSSTTTTTTATTTSSCSRCRPSSSHHNSSPARSSPASLLSTSPHAREHHVPSPSHHSDTPHTNTNTNTSTKSNTDITSSASTSTGSVSEHHRSTVPRSSAYYPLPPSPPPSLSSHTTSSFSISPLCVSAQSILQWGGIRTPNDTHTDTNTQTHAHAHTDTDTDRQRMTQARHISTVRPGEHFICVYDRDTGIDKVVAAFARNALQNHEQIVVFSDRWTEEYIRHIVEVGEREEERVEDESEERARSGERAESEREEEDSIDTEALNREGREKERGRRAVKEKEEDDKRIQLLTLKEKLYRKSQGQRSADRKAAQCVFAEGQLVVLRYNQTCFVPHTEREKRVLQFTQVAKRQGFTGVQIIGDARWIRTHPIALSGADLVEFEASCNEIYAAQARIQIGALCLYDTRMWPADYIVALLQTHPLVVMPDSQLIVKNMYYIPPPAFRASHAELRRHVLATMVQNLRESHIDLEEAHACTQSLAQRVECAQRVARQQQSIASNDLRRPLDNILSLASTLTMLDPHSPPNEQSRQNLRRFRENVTGLLEVIRDILDLFRMNSGQVHVRVAPFSVHAMLRGIVNNARELLEEKQRQQALPSEADAPSSSSSSSVSVPSLPAANTLSPSLSPRALSSFFVPSSASSMPPVFTRYRPEGGLVELRLAVDPRINSYLQGDSPKISQIITNLLSNAVKYTERGVVEIAARISDDKKLLEISVRDTGPGIPESVRPRIFLMLMQEDYLDQSAQPHSAGQSRAAIKGVGLGLHVAKRLAEMLGGDLKGESGWHM